MRSASIRILAALAVWGVMFAGPAFADQPTTDRLMQQLVAQAHREADQARAAHHPDQAKTWEAWAKLYEKIEADPLAPYETALQFTRENTQGCEQQAQQLAKAGSKAGAALYHASAAFWADLGRQLQRGGPLAIHFPKEMLTPVPGLKGTPWESEGPPVQTAARPVPRGSPTECAMLAQRARSCERMLSTQMHQSMMGQSGDDFYLVMKRHECNQAEELYVASCVSKK